MPESQSPGIQASQVKALQTELKKTVALLKAECEANAEAVARLDEECAAKEASAEVVGEVKAKLEAKDEAVRKLQTVVAEINSDATLQARRRRADATATSVEPLDPDNPMVRKVGNVLSQNTTINDCRSDVTIHEEMEAFLEALLGDQMKMGKMLFQKVVEEGVTYWSFMVNTTICCDLLLRISVRQDEEEVVVKVESVDEEELESASLPNPHSTASKKFRLLLKEGIIVLRPLQFGQTSFTFMAQVDVGEVAKDVVVASSVSALGSTAVTDENSSKGAAVKKLGAGFESAKGDKLFYKLAEMFYDRFKKEDVIDARRKADFIENIPNAPPLTGDEKKMIKESMKQVEDVASRAKRVAGTANESVEKFLYRDGEGGAAVGMTVAKIDVAAVTFFTELWLIDTYALKAENKSFAINEVWNDLDGTRSLQYTISVSPPGGFQDRLFET
ncbi:hypothetical protein TrVE_jg49 [Triparma verrucosa]|uniref:Uncharacterized protein n=1 Tax=Triparma verrucosa TaxID=1606542 RepID=A0A9W7FPD2_9STRA|nr:hypothetical protein TrVE_jg49 [Triparma verrucosa]